MLELRMIGMKNKDKLKKYWFTLTVIQVNNTKIFTLREAFKKKNSKNGDIVTKGR